MNRCRPQRDWGANLSEGFYEVENPLRGLGLRVEWDAEQMPWYCRQYIIGLEPFPSFPTNGLEDAVDNGTALSLGARERRRFSLRAEVFEGGPS